MKQNKFFLAEGQLSETEFILQYGNQEEREIFNKFTTEDIADIEILEALINSIVVRLACSQDINGFIEYCFNGGIKFALEYLPH